MDTLQLAAQAAETLIGPFDQYPLFATIDVEWTLYRRVPDALIVRLETDLGQYGVSHTWFAV